VRLDGRLVLEDYLVQVAGSRSANVSCLELAIFGSRIRVLAATKRLALQGTAS
jgi:hypothetical protein